MITGMGHRDRIREPELEAAPSKQAAAKQPAGSAAELAGMIGSSAVQHVARSPELQRSPAAAGLLSGSPATLARRALGGEDEGEGIGMGVPDTMEEWLWQQEGWAEEERRRRDAGEAWLIDRLNNSWEGDDEAALAAEEEELRRQGVFHPPIVSGLQ
jgi:hypothetical protein